MKTLYFKRKETILKDNCKQCYYKKEHLEIFYLSSQNNSVKFIQGETEKTIWFYDCLNKNHKGDEIIRLDIKENKINKINNSLKELPQKPKRKNVEYWLRWSNPDGGNKTDRL